MVVSTFISAHFMLSVHQTIVFKVSFGDFYLLSVFHRSHLDGAGVVEKKGVGVVM